MSLELNAVDIAVSQQGTLLYVTGRPSTSGRELVWVARNGSQTSLDSTWLGTFSDPAISPDGKRIAVTTGISMPDIPGTRMATVSSTSGSGDLWIRRLDNGVLTKLTIGPGVNRFPSWSGDGSSVLYAGGVNSQTIVEKHADGGTPAMSRVESEFDIGAISESPDRQWLVYQAGVGANNARIMARRQGETTSVSLFPSIAVTRWPALSPDGKWLAYGSNETGTSEIFVVPFPNVTAAQWQVSRAGGSDPHWSTRGNELFYRDNERFLVSVPVSTKPTFSMGASKRLFSLAPFLRGFAVAHDDQKFLMVKSTNNGERDRLSVYESWIEAVRKK
jgi:Tol biopolymer transport system component